MRNENFYSHSSLQRSHYNRHFHSRHFAVPVRVKHREHPPKFLVGRSSAANTEYGHVLVEVDSVVVIGVEYVEYLRRC